METGLVKLMLSKNAESTTLGDLLVFDSQRGMRKTRVERNGKYRFTSSQRDPGGSRTKFATALFSPRDKVVLAKYCRIVYSPDIVLA